MTPIRMEADAIGLGLKVKSNVIAFDEDARGFRHGRRKMPPLFERPLSGRGEDDRRGPRRRKRQGKEEKHGAGETLCETSWIHRSINGGQALFFDASLPDEMGSQRGVWWCEPGCSGGL